MVDNRTAGILGVGGGINFKSGDISGTAAKTSDDRASQGTEYFLTEGEERQTSEEYEDRSMQLRASLNSLALLNVASVLRNNRKTSILIDDESEEDSKKVPPVKKDKEKDKK